jgi:hypothetical protein
MASCALSWSLPQIAEIRREKCRPLCPSSRAAKIRTARGNYKLLCDNLKVQSILVTENAANTVFFFFVKKYFKPTRNFIYSGQKKTLKRNYIKSAIRLNSGSLYSYRRVAQETDVSSFIFIMFKIQMSH